MNNSDRYAQIENLLDDIVEEARKEGMKEGYKVANSIFSVYARNNHLIKPKSQKELEEFAQTKLSELRRFME